MSTTTRTAVLAALAFLTPAARGEEPAAKESGKPSIREWREQRDRNLPPELRGWADRTKDVDRADPEIDWPALRLLED